MDTLVNIIHLTPERWEAYRSLHMHLEEHMQVSIFEEDVIDAENYWKEKLKNEKYIMLFAEVDGSLVGMVVAVREKGAKRKHVASIAALYVVPSYTKKGIGSMLLKQLITESKKYGIEKLEMKVLTHIPIMKELSQKHGFEEIGLAKHAQKIDGVYYDEVLLEKYL